MKDIQTLAIYSGLFHNYFLKIRKKEKEDKRIENILEEERKKVQAIYNSQGKIIEYNRKNLNVKI